MGKWTTLLGKWYNSPKKYIRIHIKTIQRVNSSSPPIVFVRLATLNSAGNFQDSKKPYYPADPELLRSIGKALIDYSNRLHSKLSKISTTP